ncbi:MAG: hypothetical protein Q7T18_05980 [Sedimentisphaerales bacterium]|nr:hypothetical protein [Sedimentisphaerales bacterium]
MMSLKRNEKELIFDYFLGLAGDAQIEETKELLKTSEGAAEFYEKLSSSLQPLEYYAVETCPQHLTESTILRLNMAALASHEHLAHLLKKEQSRSPLLTKHRSFWANFAEVAAIAAMIFIVAGISFPTLQAARQNYWKTKCSAQLASLSTGIGQYAAEHNQTLPSVATAAGSPWWKVGYQGSENQSNTRHLWLLVQGKYVEPEAFVCPARIEGKALKFDRTQVSKLSDFPGRKYVTYSFRIFRDKESNRLIHGNKVLIADVNPVFENPPQNFGNELDVQLCKNLQEANSTNHRGCGQNILVSDGHVSFAKSRLVGTAEDDIFTIQKQMRYRGNETPASETDDFLAP